MPLKKCPSWQKGKDSLPYDLSASNDIDWKWWKMRTAVGGGPVLIHDGKVHITNREEQLFPDATGDYQPRTAMGYTRDGQFIILAIQGRTPGKAAGATLRRKPGSCWAWLLRSAQPRRRWQHLPARQRERDGPAFRSRRRTAVADSIPHQTTVTAWSSGPKSSILHIPHQRTRAQYRRIRFLKMTNKYLHLILKHLDEVRFHILPGRFQDQIPRLRQAAKRMIASGLENITKLASANPSIDPVKSKISFASVSPWIAAS